MAAFTSIAIGLGAAASVAGTVGSLRAQKKSAKAQQRQQTLSRRRSARQALRQAQIQRATALASSGGAGVADSSGRRGGVESLSSRAGEAIGFSGQQSALSNIITAQNTRAQMFSGLASIGGSLFNFAAGGGFKRNGPLDFTRSPTTA